MKWRTFCSGKFTTSSLSLILKHAIPTVYNMDNLRCSTTGYPGYPYPNPGPTLNLTLNHHFYTDWHPSHQYNNRHTNSRSLHNTYPGHQSVSYQSINDRHQSMINQNYTVPSTHNITPGPKKQNHESNQQNRPGNNHPGYQPGPPEYVDAEIEELRQRMANQKQRRFEFKADIMQEIHERRQENMALARELNMFENFVGHPDYLEEVHRLRLMRLRLVKIRADRNDERLALRSKENQSKPYRSLSEKSSLKSKKLISNLWEAGCDTTSSMTTPASYDLTNKDVYERVGKLEAEIKTFLKDLAQDSSPKSAARKCSTHIDSSDHHFPYYRQTENSAINHETSPEKKQYNHDNKQSVHTLERKHLLPSKKDDIIMKQYVPIQTNFKQRESKDESLYVPREFHQIGHLQKQEKAIPSMEGDVNVFECSQDETCCDQSDRNSMDTFSDTNTNTNSARNESLEDCMLVLARPKCSSSGTILFFEVDEDASEITSVTRLKNYGNVPEYNPSQNGNVSVKIVPSQKQKSNNSQSRSDSANNDIKDSKPLTYESPQHEDGVGFTTFGNVQFRERNPKVLPNPGSSKIDDADRSLEGSEHKTEALFGAHDLAINRKKSVKGNNHLYIPFRLVSTLLGSDRVANLDLPEHLDLNNKDLYIPFKLLSSDQIKFKGLPEAPDQQSEDKITYLQYDDAAQELQIKHGSPWNETDSHFSELHVINTKNGDGPTLNLSGIMSPCEIIDRIYEGTVACFFPDRSSGQYRFTAMYRKPADTTHLTDKDPAKDWSNIQLTDTREELLENHHFDVPFKLVSTDQPRPGDVPKLDLLGIASKSDIDVARINENTLSDLVSDCEEQGTGYIHSSPLQSLESTEPVYGGYFPGVTSENKEGHIPKTLPSYTKKLESETKPEMAILAADGIHNKEEHIPNRALSYTKKPESETKPEMSTLDGEGTENKEGYIPNKAPPYTRKLESVTRTEMFVSASDEEVYMINEGYSPTMFINEKPTVDHTNARGENTQRKGRASAVLLLICYIDFNEETQELQINHGSPWEDADSYFSELHVTHTKHGGPTLDLSGINSLCDIGDRLYEGTVGCFFEDKGAGNYKFVVQSRNSKYTCDQIEEDVKSCFSSGSSEVEAKTDEKFITHHSKDKRTPSGKMVKENNDVDSDSDFHDISDAVYDDEEKSMDPNTAQKTPSIEKLESVKAKSPIDDTGQQAKSAAKEWTDDLVKKKEHKKSAQEKISAKIESSTTKLSVEPKTSESESSDENISNCGNKVEGFKYTGSSSDDDSPKKVPNKTVTGKKTASSETKANRQYETIGLYNAGSDISCLYLDFDSQKPCKSQDIMKKNDIGQPADTEMFTKRSKIKEKKQTSVASDSDSNGDKSSKTTVQAFVYDGSSSDDFQPQRAPSKTVTAKLTVSPNTTGTRKARVSDSESDNISCLDLGGEGQNQHKQQKSIKKVSPSDNGSVKVEDSSKSVGKVSTKPTKRDKSKNSMVSAAARSDSSGDNSSRNGTRVQAIVYDGSSSDDNMPQKITSKSVAPGKLTALPQAKANNKDTVGLSDMESDISCLDLSSQKQYKSEEMVKKLSSSDNVSVKKEDSRKSAYGNISTESSKRDKSKNSMAPAAAKSDSSGDNSSRNGTRVQAFVYDGSSSDDNKPQKITSTSVTLGNSTRSSKNGKSKFSMAPLATKSESSSDNSFRNGTRVQAFTYDSSSSDDYPPQKVLSKTIPSKTGNRKKTVSAETKSKVAPVIELSESESDDISCLEWGDNSQKTPNTLGCADGDLSKDPVKNIDKKSAKEKLTDKKLNTEKPKPASVLAAASRSGSSTDNSSISDNSSSSDNSSENGTKVKAFVYDGSSSDDPKIPSITVTRKKTEPLRSKANSLAKTDSDSDSISCLDLGDKRLCRPQGTNGGLIRTNSTNKDLVKTKGKKPVQAKVPTKPLNSGKIALQASKPVSSDDNSFRIGTRVQAFVCDDSSSEDAFPKKVFSKNDLVKKESSPITLASDTDNDLSCIDLADDGDHDQCQIKGMVGSSSPCHGDSVKQKDKGDPDSDISCILLEGKVSSTRHAASSKASKHQKQTCMTGDSPHQTHVLNQSEVGLTNGKQIISSKSEDTSHIPKITQGNVTRSVSGNIEEAEKKKERSFLGNIRKTLKKGDVRRKQKDGLPTATPMASTSKQKSKSSKIKSSCASGGENDKDRKSLFPKLGSAKKCEMSFPGAIEGYHGMPSSSDLTVSDSEATDRSGQASSNVTTASKKLTKDERIEDRGMHSIKIELLKEIQSDPDSELSYIELEDTAVTIDSKPTQENQRDKDMKLCVISRKGFVAAASSQPRPVESRRLQPLGTHMKDGAKKVSAPSRSDTDSDISCIDIEKAEIKSVLGSKSTTKTQKYEGKTQASDSSTTKFVDPNNLQKTDKSRSSTMKREIAVNKMSPSSRSDTDSDISYIDLEEAEFKVVESKPTPTKQKHEGSTKSKKGVCTTVPHQSTKSRRSPPVENSGNTEFETIVRAFSPGTTSNEDSDISCIDLDKANVAVKTLPDYDSHPDRTATATDRLPKVHRPIQRTKSSFILGSDHESPHGLVSDVDSEELATPAATKSTTKTNNTGSKLAGKIEPCTRKGKIDIFTASSFLQGGSLGPLNVKLSTKPSRGNNTDSDVSDDSRKQALLQMPRLKTHVEKLKKAATKFFSNIKTKMKKPKSKADKSKTAQPISSDCRCSAPAKTVMHSPIVSPDILSDEDSDLSCIDLDETNNNVNCCTQGCLSPELEQFLFPDRELQCNKGLSLTQPGTLAGGIRHKFSSGSCQEDTIPSNICGLGANTDAITAYQSTEMIYLFTDHQDQCHHDLHHGNRYQHSRSSNRRFGVV
ncbi:serine-rich adhesin for platelets-like [Argopecten irradians]|uniref:serine-rich adhesin for platelets-like n=1 Tax=Argopecten irradians TaxID=31199 RepID=UPI003713A67B